MRTTLSLDDDVAALLDQVQKKRREATLKQVVNEALRHGLERMNEPGVRRKPFRTRPVDLGKCRFPNLDKIWEVLTEAGGETYR